MLMRNSYIEHVRSLGVSNTKNNDAKNLVHIEGPRIFLFRILQDDINFNQSGTNKI